jgi:ABC-type oligopeptide transport system ATPase subunit
MTTLLETHGLTKLYPVRRGFRSASLHAVDGVDVQISKGECVGLVGESGCGKSTLARLVAGLIGPTAGDIDFAAGARVQVVFQDPHESLNPGFTAFACVADPVRRLLRLSGAALDAKVLASCRASWRGVTRISFPAARKRASASPALWRSIQN